MTDKSIKTVSIGEAKAHLSKLVDQAAKGEPFIIAKKGKPLVKVSAVSSPSPKKTRRFGFMEGQVSIPDDFDTMHSAEIEKMFYGDE